MPASDLLRSGYQDQWGLFLRSSRNPPSATRLAQKEVLEQGCASICGALSSSALQQEVHGANAYTCCTLELSLQRVPQGLLEFGLECALLSAQSCATPSACRKCTAIACLLDD